MLVFMGVLFLNDHDNFYSCLLEIEKKSVAVPNKKTKYEKVSFMSSYVLV